jgi:hypothetical protein
MKPEIERNLGAQPIARTMREHNLKPHNLVAASSVEMTHKTLGGLPAVSWSANVGRDLKLASCAVRQPLDGLVRQCGMC